MVALRSASVMIQKQLSPWPLAGLLSSMAYAERRRVPSWRAWSFRAASSLQTLPQSPQQWRRRQACIRAQGMASRAPRVATICPSEKGVKVFLVVVIFVLLFWVTPKSGGTGEQRLRRCAFQRPDTGAQRRSGLGLERGADAAMMSRCPQAAGNLDRKNKTGRQNFTPLNVQRGTLGASRAPVKKGRGREGERKGQ